jgi:hypothetical protein
MTKRIFLICLMAWFGLYGMSAQNEVITNETIVELLKEGFSDGDIIGLIENSVDRDITFDIAKMRALKEAGAGSELIQYVQKIAKVDQGYEGVLWWNTTDGSKPKKLYRTPFEHETKSGFGGIVGIGAAVVAPSVLNSGVGRAAEVGLLTSSASIKKVVMQGAQAKVVLTGDNGRQPVFRFFFPKEETSSFENTADAWYYFMMNDVESPNEFQCIKLTQKKSKRTFPEGITYSVAGFSTTSKSRDIIDFEIKDISNNVFEVSFPGGLEPGEYCFFYKNGVNNTYFAQHMFGFDFSVQ